MQNILLAEVALTPEPPTALLAVHAVAGAIALLAGVLAAIWPKPGCAGLSRLGKFLDRASFLHVWLGRAYLVAIAVLCVTGVPMLAYQPSYGMVGLMLLSLYLAYTGWHNMGRVRSTAGERAILVPIVIALFGIIVACCASYHGQHANGDGQVQLAILWASVFTVLMLATADTSPSLRNKPEGYESRGAFQAALVSSHIWRMLMSVALTVTVYSVLNMEFLPVAARWLWAPVLTVAALPFVFRIYQRLIRSPLSN